MAIFFDSLKNIYASNSKKAFMLSLLAVASWLLAISVALLSERLALNYANLISTTFLVFSALFSFNAIPRSPQNRLAGQTATVKTKLHEH